jgi:diguanylate cyclase (GGDEF)-like protein/PAS domain S-box-containing protein
MVSASHWWQGILARSLFAVVGIAVLLGGAASLIISRTIGEQEREHAVQGLSELIDTVENTASIASFAKDEQLAVEVVQGLLRNTDVLRVVIRAGDSELARAERVPKADAQQSKVGPDGAASWQVARRLTSPFKRSEVVGDIVLDADWLAIDARINKTILDTVLFLSWQMALVVAALVSSMFFLVVRPIKATSDRLHRLDAASGTQLDVPEGHDNSEIGRLVGDINDLTGRLVATLDQERALRQQQAIAQRKYQDLFEHAASGIFVADRDGRLESFNRAFIDLIWLPRRDVTTGRTLTETGWREPEHLLALLRNSLDDRIGDTALEDDFLLDGWRDDERWVHVAVMPLGDGSVQGTVTDVTQRKYEELSARRLAITDPLTGFANRTGLQNVLATIAAQSPAFSLLLLDLDGFKQINDAMGFPVGDQLLLMVAARMRAFLHEGDGVARIGGDEFVLILAYDHERAAVDARVDRLLLLLGQPYVLNVQEQKLEGIMISASVGVALYPADGDDLHQLLRSAELALNSVRAAGGHDYRYFDPALLAAVEHRRRIEDDLRRALDAGEFHLAFQPIVDLASGQLVGAEALLRWTHPERGAVSPEIFIPLAEDIGLIGEIGLMVLDEACRQVAAWRRAGLDIYVSVNVSVRQIPDALPPLAVSSMLKQHGLPVEAIVIEITEGVLMSDVTTAQTWIDSLRVAGFRIYLDDFGTGYSSLSYLKRFPMDTVKIDKSFIHDMAADNSDRTLVEAIITMAGSLGLKVVAEGVETASQLDILRQIGCGYGQGYLFSRPVKGEDFPHVAARINAAAISGGSS